MLASERMFISAFNNSAKTAPALPKSTPKQTVEELADSVIHSMAVAQAGGVTLGDAIVARLRSGTQATPIMPVPEAIQLMRLSSSNAVRLKLEKLIKKDTVFYNRLVWLFRSTKRKSPEDGWPKE